MTLFLKQSTSIDIRMGPFVDNTDAVTPETGVTLASADQAEVLKANGAATVAMGGTFAAVTGADGWYDYTVAAGDVDTVGEVVFVVQDADVCLPVLTRGYVVEEAVYDAMYGASSAGPLQATTAGRTLDVLATGEVPIDFDTSIGTLDAAQIGSNAITAAKIAASALDGKGDWNIGKTGYSLTQTFPTNFADLSITATDGRVDVGSFLGTAVAAATASGEVAANVTEWLGTAVTADASNRPNVNVQAISASQNAASVLANWLAEGAAAFTATGGSTTTIVDTALTEADDYWNGCMVIVTAGTNAGFSAIVTDFDQGTNTLTITPAMPSANDATTVFTLVPGLAWANVEAWNGSVVTNTAGTPSVNIEKLRGNSAAATNMLADYDGTGYAGGTIPKQADVTEWLGTAAATPTVAGVPEIDITHVNGTAVTDSTAGVMDVNTVRINNSLLAAQVLGNWLLQGATGTADSGTTTTLVDAALTEANDYWNGALLVITGGTNAGHSAVCLDFIASSDTITFNPAMPSAIDATSTYVLVPGMAWADLRSVRQNIGAVTNILADYDGTGYAGGTIPKQADVTEWLGTAATADGSGRPDVNVEAVAGALQAGTVLGSWLNEGTTGTADSGTTTTLVDAALTNANDYWNDALLVITGGTNNGYSARVSDFDAASDTVTFTPAMPSAIDATSTYVLVPGLGHANASATVDNAAIADAVWDEARADHTTGGSFGEGVNVEEWLGTAVAATTAGVPNTNTVAVNDSGQAAINLGRWLGSGQSGIADSGTTTTIVDTGITDADDFWNGSLCVFSTGSLSGQAVFITDWDLGTNTFTFSPATTAAVSTGDTFNLIPWAMVNANVEAWLGTAVNETTAGYPDVNIERIEGNANAAITLGRWMQEGIFGTADSGSTTTLVDAGLAQATDDYWNGSLLVIRTGTNAGFTAVITDFDEGDNQLTFTPAMPSAIDATSTYVIVPGLGFANVEAWLGTAVTADTAGIPNVNTKEINGAGLVGDGNATPWDGA